MRISDWSSDVCSSDLCLFGAGLLFARLFGSVARQPPGHRHAGDESQQQCPAQLHQPPRNAIGLRARGRLVAGAVRLERSEEHTSELQSLMRISYAVFCLKKKTNT